jgi:hypothetical protein
MLHHALHELVSEAALLRERRKRSHILCRQLLEVARELPHAIHSGSDAEGGAGVGVCGERQGDLAACPTPRDFLVNIPGFEIQMASVKVLQEKRSLDV